MNLYDDDDDDFMDKPLQIMPLTHAAGTKPAARAPPTIIGLHALLIQSKD